jgi:general secretion pathway protein J
MIGNATGNTAHPQGSTRRAPGMTAHPQGRTRRAPGMALHRGRRGFTLFEMLIAVSIFAIIGVMAFGGLGQMTRTGQAVADANNRLSELQFAVVYFSRDWIQVSPRKIRNQYGDEESNIVIDDGVITFTRSGWSNLLGHKRSTLQRVQYLVLENQLIRRHWRSLDQGVAELPLEAVLLDDVESLEVEFLDALKKPIRSWPVDSALDGGKPIVLAFRLDLTDIGEITRILELPDGAL